jgi:pentapeptide MXKDX repeat protein
MSPKFAAALVALTLAFVPPAFAETAMGGDAMGAMAPMDPMATDCITKAEAETDAMKMDAMMGECAKTYPDAVAAHCMMKAEMETDAMKHDDMVAGCQAMFPGAMAPAAM